MFTCTRWIAILAFACTPTASFAQQLAPERPNILFFVADDLGAVDIAVSGSEFYLTPNIDALAERGVRFTQAYAAFPRCTPSRYALMSGRNPARSGSPGRFEGLDHERISIAEALKEYGYATYFLGKWHLTGNEENSLPTDHGFDVNVGGGHAGAPGSYSWPYTRESNQKEHPIEGLEDGEEGLMLTDHLTDRAEVLVREHVTGKQGQPFFMVLSHYGVHTPFEDTKERERMFEDRLDEVGRPSGDEHRDTESEGTEKLHQDNATYAAMVYRLDESLGQMVALLDELGIADNTVVVFTSDHGGLSNRGLENGRKLATSNAPFRAGKGHLYEGGIRVPMIVSYPGHTEAGLVSEQVTVGSDHYATFLELAGAEPMPEAALDSVSYAAALRSGEVTEREPIYWYSPRPRPTSTGDHASAAIRIGDYKLIYWYESESVELFNLADDPSETTDLSASMAERTERMQSDLLGWLDSIDAVKPRTR